MCNSITVANHYFRNLEACKAECKRKIRKFSTIRAIPEKEQHFFKELFKLHPDYDEKRGVGIESVRYGYERKYGTKCLIVVRYDGSEKSISWMSCLKRPTVKHKVQQAFRKAVEGDVNIFKAAAVFSDPYCSLTGEKLGFNNSRVVYNKGLSFNELLGEFLWFMDIPYQEVGAIYPRDEECKLPVVPDEMLVAKWRKYHKEMAEMSIMSDKPDLKKEWMASA